MELIWGLTVQNHQKCGDDFHHLPKLINGEDLLKAAVFVLSPIQQVNYRDLVNYFCHVVIEE